MSANGPPRYRVETLALIEGPCDVGHHPVGGGPGAVPGSYSVQDLFDARPGAALRWAAGTRPQPVQREEVK